jgi:hypothetical protein
MLGAELVAATCSCSCWCWCREGKSGDTGKLAGLAAWCNKHGSTNMLHVNSHGWCSEHGTANMLQQTGQHVVQVHSMQVHSTLRCMTWTCNKHAATMQVLVQGASGTRASCGLEPTGLCGIPPLEPSESRADDQVELTRTEQSACTPAGPHY